LDVTSQKIFAAEGASMIKDPSPIDSLFIKLGWLQIGASGRWALAALIVIGAGIFLGRYLKMW
jgi:hypothetical protein